MKKTLKFKNLYLVLGVILFLFAFIWYANFHPSMIMFGSNYIFEAEHVGQAVIYNEETGEWEDLQETMERSDLVVEDHGDVLVLRSIVRGVNMDGIILFEASSRYGVDKDTKENVAGYGDQDREGQFSFPPNVEKKDYLFHSPEVLEAPAMVSFVQELELDGLELYEFEYLIEDIDKTEFFPEFLTSESKVIGSHYGSLFVEPSTGYLVDFVHGGENWIQTSSGDFQDFQKWENEFDDISVESHLQVAKNHKRNVFLLSVILPLLALCLGGASLFYFFKLNKKK